MNSSRDHINTSLININVLFHSFNITLETHYTIKWNTFVTVYSLCRITILGVVPTMVRNECDHQGRWNPAIAFMLHCPFNHALAVEKWIIFHFYQHQPEIPLAKILVKKSNNYEKIIFCLLSMYISHLATSIRLCWNFVIMEWKWIISTVKYMQSHRW